MAVVTRKFERKNKSATYMQGWLQRFAGGASVLLIAMAVLHFLGRFGMEWARGWDVIGWIIGWGG